MGVRKGCYQCNKRRITCDRAEPHCSKCISRGLECSGNGLHFRFNDGIASRGKFRGQFTPIAKSCRPQRQSRAIAALDAKCKPRILPFLETTDSHSRFFLDYFSMNIAPGMVILDRKDNGYRSIILPLALQDRLLLEAITSVAQLQISHNHLSIREAAEIRRARVINQLSQSSRESDLKKVFTISSWLTLLVLFIGELIEGGDHYEYLLRMMCTIKRYGVVDPNIELLQFLNTQTELISYLAQPFIDNPSHVGILSSEQGLRHTLLVSEGQRHSNAEQRIINIAADAAELCSQILAYRNDLRKKERKPILDCLKCLVSEVPPDSAGGNSLVWVHFIGAVESETTEDYVFFRNCLIDIHKATRWNNIALGLSMLEQVRQSAVEDPWGMLLPNLPTAFVM